MKQFIRAEDFEIDGDRMILGGRVLEGASVLFAHVEKRNSAELLGFSIAMAVCILIALSGQSGIATLGTIGLALLFGLGVRREIIRAYVLVINIYQLDIFEVRGFTRAGAEAVEAALDDLRRGSTRRSTGQRSGYLAGSFN